MVTYKETGRDGFAGPLWTAHGKDRRSRCVACMARVDTGHAYNCWCCAAMVHETCISLNPLERDEVSNPPKPTDWVCTDCNPENE
jgi:hypothetical protein